ncbi:MAG: adenylate/guanylate cyclase domain-containing protein [Acidimicrobiales bacterium]
MGRVRELVHDAAVRFNDKADVLARLLRLPAIGPRAAVLSLKVIAQQLLANGIAGLFVTFFLTLTEEEQQPNPEWPVLALRNAILYAGLLGFFALAAIVRGRIAFAPSWRWLDQEGPPTAEQRRQLLEQPVRIGVFPFKYWVAAAVIAVTGGAILGEEADRLVVIAGAILQGGLVACAIGYLAGERALRPALAEALAGQPPDTPATIGLRSRLLLAWALGSAIPFVGIALTPLVPDETELPLWVPMAFLAVAGLAGGAALTFAAAASIIGPVRQVRAALQEVAGGDLDVEVVVDDGGQLGQLQAGVNELVDNLRQRRRLEDLFGRHVGFEVARQAMERGAELGGEMRVISALFVDLRGSTQLARTLHPHEVVERLNRFFETLVRCSDAEDGWVDKFEGDGALCVFGAPADQPDHASRCLRTARSLAAALASLRERYPDLDAGIGVAAGSAVAGHVGTETRLEYTVIGPPVNTAARLVIAAKDRRARVLADGEIVRCVAGSDEAAWWQPSGTVDLKGLQSDFPVWEPVDVASTP